MQKHDIHRRMNRVRRRAMTASRVTVSVSHDWQWVSVTQCHSDSSQSNFSKSNRKINVARVTPRKMHTCLWPSSNVLLGRAASAVLQKPDLSRRHYCQNCEHGAFTGNRHNTRSHLLNFWITANEHSLILLFLWLFPSSGVAAMVVDRLFPVSPVSFIALSQS